jgi:general secretion pathway protein J
MYSRWKQQRGVTLVEVVVATLILSLIMLATVTAMRTFGRTYDTLLQRTDQTAEMREVSRFLRLALRDALGEPATFSGDATVVSWATPLDRVGSAGGIQYLKLSHSGDGLMLSFAPFDPAQVGAEEPGWGLVVDDFVLVDELERFAVAYRETPFTDWIDRWDPDASPTIPWAVSVSIAASGVQWPPVVVVLQSSTAL